MAKKTQAPVEENVAVQETAAADTLKPHPENGSSKADLLHKAVVKLAGMKIEDLSHFFNDSIAQIGHEADNIPSGSAEKNKATINAKEEIEALFAGQELTEEFLTKATVLFESAVNVKAALIKAELEEQFEADLVEQVQAIHEEVTSKVNDFVMYSAQEYIKENQIAIDTTLKAEITEDLLAGIKNVFAENYIDMPEEKLDVVEALSEKVEELENKLNQSIADNIELSKIVAEAQMAEVVNGLSEGLTMTQAEKFATLVESVEFDGDLESYETKLALVKEHHFGKKTPSTKMVVENTENALGNNDEGETKKAVAATPEMKTYASIISRTHTAR